MEKLRKKKSRILNPPRVLVIGFLGLIFLGALLLNTDLASKDGSRIGFINALFTSASAVCVTGLTVVNTAAYWSNFGHLVIIVLIQIGGLGFMTMATLVALFMGKKISLKERLVIKEQLNEESMAGLVRLVKYVLFSTFIIEGIGAILLGLRFVPLYGPKKGIWFSVFHAISGFCNAGFDLTGDSIAPFVTDPLINLTIAALIILGGLGFSVYIDLMKKKNFRGLKVHSKMVILMTLALLLLGSLGILLLEYSNPETLGQLALKDKGLAAFFQSAISRTAGFYSVDLSKLHESTVFLMIILMFIGGSPASTAGGIKTTTFGVLVLTTLSVIRGDEDVVAFKRRIPTEIVGRAIAIITISLLLVLVVSLILTITEDAAFIDILFESTSAFATVGVSRNLSPNLSNIGKLIIAATMYLGRVGPLTMGFAFAMRRKKENFRYADCNILVG